MKSHFTFSKEQRNGIFLLVIIIIVFQCIYFFIDFKPECIAVNKVDLEEFTKEIDSLRHLEVENNKPIIYPFNPNYINDFKGTSLGMSNVEIDRLIAFRNKNQWINSVKQFQQVTEISDSLLRIISPYFKFPDWITASDIKPIQSFNVSKTAKTYVQKQDLNRVSAEELQKVNGVGAVLSERIIKFRNKFSGGFIADIQLQDVYGLTPEVIEKIICDFTVKTPRNYQKVYLNTATIEELVTIQHIDYSLANRIIEQRTLREGYKSLDELTKVKDFPVNKIDIIKLYLSLEKEN